MTLRRSPNRARTKTRCRSNSIGTRSSRQAFDAHYRQCIEASSILSSTVDALWFLPCALRVHALRRRYDPERTRKIHSASRRR